MTKIRLTKEFNFEMAHALWKYDGLCKNIHGHSYKLFVTVIGEPNQDSEDPKLGMLIDFGDLKQIVNEQIISRLDHTLVLNKKVPSGFLKNSNEMFDRIELTDYQPTCENLIIDFVERIRKHLPRTIQLHSLKLHETETSFAEWYDSDNK